MSDKLAGLQGDFPSSRQEANDAIWNMYGIGSRLYERGWGELEHAQAQVKKWAKRVEVLKKQRSAMDEVLTNLKEALDWLEEIEAEEEAP